MQKYLVAAVMAGALVRPEVSPAQPGVQQGAPRTSLPSADEARARLQHRFDALSGFSGVAIVEIGGRIVFARAAGRADAAGRPFTVDTPVSIGSLTKALTAAAILSLQDQGRLSTNDPVSRFFPDAPQPLGAVTIHQLLTHSSGLPLFLPGAPGNPDLEQLDRAAFLVRLYRSPLQFAPGEGFEYSNAGYSLLAAIVEQVSGQPYAAYLRDHIVRPAGVTRIGYQDAFDQSNGARSRDGRSFSDMAGGAGGPYWNLMGNGGVVVVAQDFVNWRRAFARGRIVSPQAVRATGTAWVSQPPRVSEGYGWIVGNSPARGPVELAAGGNDAFTSEMRFYRNDDVIIFVATNGLRPAGMTANALVRALYSETEPAPQEIANPAEAELVRRFTAALLEPDAATRRAFLVENAGPRFVERIGHGEIERRFAALHTALSGARLIRAEPVGPQGVLLEFSTPRGPRLVAMAVGGSPERPRVAGFDLE